MTISTCAVRRASETRERANLTRRGAKLALAFDARTLKNGAQAYTEVLECSSAGLARAAMALYAEQAALHPDKHPSVILRQSVSLIEAHRWQARRRMRGPRTR